MSYLNDWRNDIVMYKIRGGGFVAINPKLEQERMDKARGLLSAYGKIFNKGHGPGLVQHMQLAGVSVEHAMNGRCYDVARAMCRGTPNLVYCEGFCAFNLDSPVPTGVALAHGWAADRRTGQIYDPTLSGTVKSQATYFGVGIRTDYADKWKDRNGYYGLLDGTPDGVVSGVYLDYQQEWRVVIP